MRQVICNMGGARVARVPRPSVEPGRVLVRVRYSLISAGTELAALRPSVCATEDTGTLEKAREYTSLARRYLGLALRHPDKAAIRACQIIIDKTGLKRGAKPAEPKQLCDMSGLCWEPCAARSFNVGDDSLTVVSDDSPYGYQVLSKPLAIEQGLVPVIHLQGELSGATISVGVLDERREAWLGSRTYEPGPFEDRLIFDPKDSREITLAIAGAGSGGQATLTLNDISVTMSPPELDGLPLSELDDQGWNVGYCAAGEVIAVGQGVRDIVPGTLVACGGAGIANHADYVSVPRNLVCPVPADCSLQEAATTIVGTIALQGVRRAAPQIGETIAVIGLGLIGQMTVQLLRANGCRVVGMDLDQARVDRATTGGMDAGATSPEALKLLLRDATGGRGADCTIITAATKSSAVINLSMETTRAKGRVVLVGDVGMNVERPQFYRKEIDVLMSTSYGPGRYDAEYETQGHDYPYAYVRWTINRNMQAFLDLMAAGRIDIPALIDRVVTVDEAAKIYKELAQGGEAPPLAVLLHYPDEGRELPKDQSATKVTIRGHRPTPSGPLRYALVGAGAFGTCMLVPQMARRKDRFFLRAVVSRDAVRGGNFARTNQVEVLATSLDDILTDPDIDLVVIATRHDDHADKVIRCIEAGKHVFVEKPLCLTWEELERIQAAYDAQSAPPLIMAGFNRRFSPALAALRKAVAQRRSPLVVNYRLNGGYIPPEHWIQTAQGGGRNIGEACHMYDVFRSLAGAAVTSISATAISPGTSHYLRNDNFCATLAYGDGSVGNLVYTALGPKQGLPKERIEVFCDGEAYVVDDFTTLTRASDGALLYESTEMDKGHYEELSRFGDAIATGQAPPISFEAILETTAVALHVEDLLNS